MPKSIQTAEELLAKARVGRPNVRYARHRKGWAIGAWVEEMGRFVTVASQGITGEWYSMPYEILVNGQLTHTASDWIE